MENLKEIVRELDARTEEGGCQEFSYHAGRKYLHICRNNGQAHMGDWLAGHQPGGWADYVGKCTLRGAKQLLEGRLNENDILEGCEDGFWTKKEIEEDRIQSNKMSGRTKKWKY